MRRLFWVLVAFFTAVLVHGVVILAIPSLTLERTIRHLAASDGSNRFFVMKDGDQARLFPTYPPTSVVGACVFDVSHGPVDLKATMPSGFWVLTIYSSKGDVLYTANNRQAGTDSFTLRLQQAPGLLEMLREQKNEDSPVGNAWTVKTPEASGLAVLWQPADDPALRQQLARTIGGSNCGAATG